MKKYFLFIRFVFFFKLLFHLSFTQCFHDDIYIFRHLPSSKSHFVISLNDSNRRAIRHFSVRLSKSVNSFELQIIFKSLYPYLRSVLHVERVKEVQHLLQLFWGHKTHHFHFITSDTVWSVLSSSACVSSFEVAEQCGSNSTSRVDGSHFVSSFPEVHNLRVNKYLKKGSVSPLASILLILNCRKAYHTRYRIRQLPNYSCHDSTY